MSSRIGGLRSRFSLLSGFGFRPAERFRYQFEWDHFYDQGESVDHDSHIVQITHYGQEIRYQVDGISEVRGDRGRDEFHDLRDAPVGQDESKKPELLARAQLDHRCVSSLDWSCFISHQIASRSTNATARTGNIHEYEAKHILLQSS